MQYQQVKQIFDCQGNDIKREGENKVKQFIKENLWNILGQGLVVCGVILGMIDWFAAKIISSSCGKFYGIDGKYFSGVDMFEDELVWFLLI